MTHNEKFIRSNQPIKQPTYIHGIHFSGNRKNIWIYEYEYWKDICEYNQQVVISNDFGWKKKKYCIVYNINDNALNAGDLKRNDFFLYTWFKYFYIKV